MALVTGDLIAKMDGESLRLKQKSGELDFGGFEREAVMADLEVVGPMQSAVPSKFTGTLVHTSQTDLAKLRDARDVTLIIQTDTGKQYTMRNAFLTKPPVVKAGGDVDVEFAGKPAVETS